MKNLNYGTEGHLFSGEPEYYCDWQTANTLTDHQVVKCTNPATHQLEDEAFDMHHLCLAHADLHRTITGEVLNRIEKG